MRSRLSADIWLWPPIIWAAFQILIEATLPPKVLSDLQSENGPHELVQFFILLIALFVSARTFQSMDKRRNPWLTGWVVVAGLCCLYVAGEEMSWGQTIAQWHTPEQIAALNDQDETNLHNMSSWLDQKPRALLEIGTIIGGLLIPGLRRWKPALLPARFDAIYPTDAVVPTAVIYLVFKVAEAVGRHFFHVNLFERAAEVSELYMYYFVMIYMLDLRQRLTARPALDIAA